MDSECVDDDGDAYQWESQVFEKIYIEAESGDADSQFQLALLFSGKGGVIAPNPQKQAEWYQRAAEQDHWPAMNNLACMYRDGNGVGESKEKAFELFFKAAQNELMLAQSNVARCFENGSGVAKNLDFAFDWYNAAGKQGDAISLFKCGCFYFDGIGRPKDKNLGFDFFKQAAEKGHTYSTYLVGYCLQFGIGIAKSDDFVDWYVMAADAGHARANLELSRCYEKGMSVDIDTKKTEKYLYRASELGSAEAKYLLYKNLISAENDLEAINKANKFLEESSNLGFMNARYDYALSLIKGNFDFVGDIDLALKIIENSLDIDEFDFYSLLTLLNDSVINEDQKKKLFQINKKAADLFNGCAAFDVAKKFEAGIGVAVDLESAHLYMSKAAALGHFETPFMLAQYYQHGIGCDIDPRQTITIYYHIAFSSNLNSIEAIGFLADCFSQGTGVLKNYIFAYALSNYGAAEGDSRSRYKVSQVNKPNVMDSAAASGKFA